jgi:hypothetical protein
LGAHPYAAWPQEKPMQHKFGMTLVETSFNEAVVNAVWGKGSVVPGYNPDQVRKDACGALIVRNHYGKTTEFGWEIDHIKPVAMGGTDLLSNLQPLQWQNNRHKSDNWPNWSCKVRAA